MFTSELKTVETLLGTTGTTFTIAAKTDKVVVGYRELGGDKFRVRAELINGVQSLNLPYGWRTPDSEQRRYSIVVHGVANRNAAIATAVAAAL